MKSSFLFLLPSVFFAASLFAGEGPEVATTWPGVKLQVSDIRRLDDTHVLMVIRLKSTGAEPVAIGELPKEPPSRPSKPSTGGLNDAEELPRPFSLESARLVDETTKQEFTALPSLPSQPFFGPNAMVTTLSPGGWIQMAVHFNAPPPLPPGKDGKRPPQKVTALFPRAAKPMPGLVLPATTGEATVPTP